MRFFTLEWWRGAAAHTDAQVSELYCRYRQHVDSIKHRLSDPVHRLANPDLLHDAELDTIELRDGTLKMAFFTDGQFVGGDIGSAHRVEVTYVDTRCLNFVTSDWEDLTPMLKRLHTVGYSEVDIADGECFCHRMICIPGIEIVVIAKDARLQISGPL